MPWEVRWRVQGDVSYSDEYYYNLRNFDADQSSIVIPSVNAQISWTRQQVAGLATLAARQLDG